jgi:hypothetical protein
MTDRSGGSAINVSVRAQSGECGPLIGLAGRCELRGQHPVNGGTKIAQYIKEA